MGSAYLITLTDNSNGNVIAQSQTPTLTYTFPNVGDYTAVCTIDGQADLGACTESVYVNNIEYPDVFVEKDRLT